ncbi:sensor histidine kinase [Aquimarina longa]|uniref:sensor histidine kinase n=1 Tax=Aquimarina longa TaxID=1080221 RepID=UPI000781692C|nr:HAMP domain-containing sensor histidine kinase [Aquimarina longa]
MGKKIRKKFNNILFDKILVPVLFIFICTIIHGIIEYFNAGISLYFVRNGIIFLTIIICYLLYRRSVITRSFLLIFSIYVIVIGILFTFLLAYNNPNFLFEITFLKAELILMLFIFAIGMLIHFKHIIFLVGFNIIFSIVCYTTIAKNYPIENFLFIVMLVSGSGMITYIIKRNSMELGWNIKQKNKLILLQNKKLKEMNKSKDQVLRIIGHDLRTPFHQLKELIRMMKEVDNEQERIEIEGYIKESADKGSQLLEDLLSWGKTYQNESKIVLVKMSLYEIIERVFEFSDQERKMKKISLINKLSADIEFMINPIMMETVFRNLISNSIKFSHLRSKIIVSGKQFDEKIKISVRDTGVGMTKEYIDQLFLQDQNISTLGTDNEEGIGYGLGITKKLVEKQNGILEIESKPNRGTTIHMCFPLYSE